MAKITYSKYQKSLFKEVENTNDNLIVQAVAGSGKTTSAIKCLDYIPSNESILFLAFNKSIVQELKDKVPKNVRVSTLHSIGFWLIMTNTGDNRKVNFNKFNEIYEEIIKSTTKYKAFFSKEHNVRNFKFFIKNLSDLVKSNNIDYTSEIQLKDLMEFYDISMSRYSFSLIKGAIKQICQKSLDIDKYWVDFSDMIWLPIQLGYKDAFNYIFVDEAQDLNMAQMKLLQNIGNDKTRYIFVGDRNQSIVGFAGSNTNSMDDIKRMFNAKEMPLSICYRCPKTHIENAQRLVPEIEPFEKNIDGYIGDIMENLITQHIKSTDDMIICRTNAPLVDICLELVRNNIKAYVKGGDLKQKILKEIKMVSLKLPNIGDIHNHFSNSVKNIDDEIEDIKQQGEEEIINAKSAEEKEWKKRQLYYKVRNLVLKQDLHLTITHFTRDMDFSLKVGLLLSKIEKIFEEDKNAVCCATIHKSKGLEADNVFLLYPHLLPHPILQGTMDWQLEQEKNVEYVALTRAKKNLINVWKEE